MVYGESVMIRLWNMGGNRDGMTPTPQSTHESDGIYFRYYPGTNVYIWTIQNDLYFYDHLGVLHNLGSVDIWLPFAQGN
jgi:hypothetical protein